MLFQNVPYQHDMKSRAAKLYIFWSHGCDSSSCVPLNARGGVDVVAWSQVSVGFLKMIPMWKRNCIYQYHDIPGTQMTPVLIGKGLLLEA